MVQSKTPEQFVEDARTVHGDVFDYSDTLYVSSQKKVVIGCRGCGLSFEQLANNHLKGSGCPRCSAAEGGRKRAGDRALFFEKRARRIHGDAYDYTKVAYRTNRVAVELYCRTCGEYFQQTPDAHLAGKGCPPCGTQRRALLRTKSTEQFIDEAIKAYGPGVFDYAETGYVMAHERVSIRCSTCARSFLRTPASHLQGHACPYCSYGNSISKAETTWLDSLDVPERQHQVTLPSGKKTKVDGYAPSTNTVYAFLGSFWHADPRKCPPDEEHPVIGRLNSEIHAETLARLQALQEAGFVVVSVWEEDWKASGL